MRRKILYVNPHMSTGGSVQYTLKQIESLIEDFDIEAVEYSNISDRYTIQRDKIKKLIKVYTLGVDKSLILKVVKDFSPNILHFQEIPETFVDEKILEEIYSEDRKYNIVVTTHGSGTDPSQIKYTPDKMVMPSKWVKEKFEKAGFECDIWEYPIENKEKLLPSVFTTKTKNILNVGLFTEGKNQGEVFELARLLPEYTFHFVGNQADNFKRYWQPLMKNKPENCIIWGERDNVENFYSSADAFYFPSKLELMPLVVKEAISYKLPTFCYNLSTYSGEFDGKVTYINDLSLEEKAELIKTNI